MAISTSVFEKCIIYTVEDAVRFTGYSRSYLYKLTSQQLIPHYKPRGKKIFFLKSELQQWLLSNPVKTIDEIEQVSLNFVVNKKK